MKFIVETKALQEGLQLVGAGVAHRTTLPILQNVLLAAEGDALWLTTCNLDLWVKAKVDVMVARDGAVTVPFNLFSRVVARITASKITLTLTKTALDIVAGDIKASFETLPADEFPPEMKVNAEIVECDASNINVPFQMVQHAICERSRGRYILEGLSIQPNGESAAFTATNGGRLATFEGNKLGETPVIVPEYVVNAALAMHFKGIIRVQIGGAIKIASDRLGIIGKLIEGTYPNWVQTIPERSKDALSCGRKELIEALRTCLIFADPKMRDVHVCGKGKEVIVSQGPRASVTLLGTELEGQPDIAIWINGTYVIDALSVMSCENVRLQREGTSPLRIEDGKFISVICGFGRPA